VTSGSAEGPKRVLVGEARDGKTGASVKPQLVGGNILPVLGVAGLALLLVGMADLVLTWYPTSFGNREWEFGTVTATLNGVPVVLMGTVFVYLAVADAGMVKTTRLLGVLCMVAAVLVIAMAGLYLTNVPLAMQAVQGPLLTGIKKAVAKTLVQVVVYPPTFAFLAWRALRHFRVKG
jgi:hypothetical protein